MTQVDERLLDESPLLRKRVLECRRMARDMRMMLAFEEILLEGESYCHALAEVSRRFSASNSTVKRAIRRMSRPPWRRRRTLGELLPLKRVPLRERGRPRKTVGNG